jgi:hypothetical protein
VSNVIKVFCPYFTNFHIKLECLSVASFFQPSVTKALA